MINYAKYEDIWLALNNPHLETINLSNYFLDENLIFTEIEQYFAEKTQIKFINFYDLKIKEKDISYLLGKKLILKYLSQNFQKSINDNYYSHKLYLDSRKFQIEAIKDKKFDVICPFSEKIIKSSKSVIVNINCIFYRFISKEVF